MKDEITTIRKYLSALKIEFRDLYVKIAVTATGIRNKILPWKN